MAKEIFLILDNIRSMENVGSIFRTADAAGVKKIYLCGITPKPPRKEIDKAALGAVDFIEWEYRENAKFLISNFKREGVKVLALEQDPRAIPYSSPNTKPASPAGGYKIPNTCDIAVIVGNEIAGIDKAVLDLADTIIEIPMHGKKNSLNVAVATGIALFEVIKQ